MKPFRTQFVECRKNGFHGKGLPLNNPGDQPLVIDLTDAEQSALKEKCTISCLKFGGICHSGNQACVDMRNLL